MMDRFRSLWKVFFPHRACWLVFLMAFAAYAFFFHRFRFWNVNSRLALTYAIVDDVSLRIDRYVDHPHFSTQDRALYDGHYYSDKIIGLSVLAVPPYWVLKQATALFDKDPKPDLSRYVLTVSVVSLSAALTLVVVMRILILLGQSLAMASGAALLLGFGTWFWPFASLFYPYAPSSLLLLATLLLILSEGRGGDASERRAPWPRPGSRARTIVIGLLVGGAMVCDYTAVVPALFLGFYYWAISPTRRQALIALAVACVPLLGFAAYNAICFGNPFSLPYAHLENETFRSGMAQGLMGVGRFQWYVLWLITLSPYRGLFCTSPFLLLAGVGVVRGLRKGSPHRGLAFLIAGAVVYYLALTASYYMWWGGGTLGVRHLVPMLPFLVLGVVWLPRRLVVSLVVLGALSIGLMLPQAVVEPHFEPRLPNAELYRPWETVRDGETLTPPFVYHSLQEFRHGRISMNPLNRHIHATDGMGWTLLPLLLVEAMFGVWLWRVVGRDGRKPTC